MALLAVIDNDVLFKGAGYGVLGEFVAALAAQSNQVGVLGNGRFVVGKKLARLGLLDAHSALMSLLDEIEELEPTDEEVELAAQIELYAQTLHVQVDSGESQLAAMTVIRAITLLVTGDKRAIEGIAAIGTVCPELAAIAGRILCLEQLVLRTLSASSDPGELRSKICRYERLDQALALCFSCKSTRIEPESWTEGLKSYVEYLRVRAPTLLTER